MLFLLTLGLLGLASANHLDTISIPAHRKTLQRNTPATLFNRLEYNGTLLAGGWFAGIDVGEPPQYMELAIDTGSSDMWIPAAQAKQCRERHSRKGNFDSSKSNTFKNAQLPQPFKIGYLDESGVEGNYSIDTIKFGTAVLQNFTFALAHEVDVTPGDKHGPQYGILGLGTKAHEVGACPVTSDHCEGGFETPTLHDALYTAGYIRSRSYSLWLQPKELPLGNILFGGIDKSKFTGPLVTLNTVVESSGPQKGKHVRQSVQLTGMGSQINGSTKAYPSSAQSMSVRRNTTEDLAKVPVIYCSQANANISLTFTLGAASGLSEQSIFITVPFRELVTPIYRGYNMSKPQKLDGQDACVVNLRHSSDPEFNDTILGVPFLHSAYVHYNIDEHTISIAKPAYNSKKPDVVAIGKGPVPNFVGTG
ncbi:hypothetical protein Q7P37_001107 [Cladosporium fusiforme]